MADTRNPADDEFKSHVCGTICDEQLIPAGSHVILGCSGGADSLALLILLADLRERLSFDLEVIHVHHGLRGADADADADFVRGWCRRLSVPFRVEHADVRALAIQLGTGLEDAGRQARYTLFQKRLEQLRADDPDRSVRIALAHHQDDQAETVLLHLGRGSGLTGLAAMRPLQGVFIRPLLDCSRSRIESWLIQAKISWRQDQTNHEPTMTRNRIRLRLLPLWQELLGYDPAPLIAGTAELLQDDLRLIETLTSQAYQACLRADHLDPAGLAGSDPALRRHVLRRFWRESTCHEPDLSRRHLGLILDWLDHARPGQYLCLPHRWQLHLNAAGLILKRASDSPQDDPVDIPPLPLRIPGVTEIPVLNFRIEAHLIENDRDIVYNSAMECFRLDQLRQCVLRTRRAGDRIHLPSRQGGRSLKKLMSELKIPVEWRDRLPLVADGSDIVWIPGIGAGRDYIAVPGGSSHEKTVCLSARPVRIWE